MTTTALTIDLGHATHRRRHLAPRLLRAELLKLRRRRGLMVLTAVLTVLPMLIGYGVTLFLHAHDAAGNGPAGGIENLSGSLEVFTLLTSIAAVLIGVTCGAGDLGAGVFRELVVTGRSRRALFAARVPAGLLLLAPFAVAGYAVTAIGSVAFAGSLPSPSLHLLVVSGLWALLGPATAFALALGVSSLVGSRSPSIAGVMAWQIAVSPLLVAAGFLGGVRQVLPLAALDALRPAGLGEAPPVTVASSTAVAVLLLWCAVPLAAGSWRTRTRDA